MQKLFFAVIIRKHPIFAVFAVIIRKHPIFAVFAVIIRNTRFSRLGVRKFSLTTFCCSNPQTPDFRGIIYKHPIFMAGCWEIFAVCCYKTTFRCYNPQTPDFRHSWVGNSQFPDRILAKIVFFVMKNDFRQKI
jgi:hypothetical protein